MADNNKNVFGGFVQNSDDNKDGSLFAGLGAMQTQNLQFGATSTVEQQSEGLFGVKKSNSPGQSLDQKPLKFEDQGKLLQNEEKVAKNSLFGTPAPTFGAND